MERHFASDNNAGVHPEVLQALAAASAGHAPSYGADAWTARVEQRFQQIFGESTEVLLVFNGTAANALALKQISQSWQGIVCAATAHINVDECGAIEVMSGRKLLTVVSKDGKLTPPMLSFVTGDLGDVHRVQPGVLSISQATEYGTVYSLDELQRLAATAHEHGLLVHMDGARISNAAAALGCGLREMTRDAGVDVVSFGGTKNGLMGAEAVLFFDSALASGTPFLRKQMMQLGSKMRFLAAQFEALFENDLWLRSATHANAMAALLASLVTALPGVAITQPVQTNAVFASLPEAAIRRLQESWRFLVWNAAAHEVRWMTAFDTTEEDVRRFAAAIEEALVESE